ncbi:SAM-dependent methyltransferase, putative [Geobacter metallireducens GS-15]|uniref:SAM-dependent methyltransferase, putative n=2 Tax=Geobacter metallireducens TaxID=28232 RepID=Q39TM5_GEOMG|nr:SAM-dependent methyltransferase, putative [Geobacter metallireducens GS-15]
MNDRQCACCASTSMKSIAPYGAYDHVRCEECGYESFRSPAAAIAAHLYENDTDYCDDLTVASTHEDLILWHHRNAVEFLRSRYPSGNAAVLDVGCFNGFFVKKLLSLGFDAHGIDFNTRAVAYGQKALGLGPRVSSLSVDQCIARGKRFDVITLFEVLEHVPAVRPFLENVLKLLKDDGVIIISTPNNNMCWRPPLDYPPHHLSRFTIASLNACLSGLGMKSLYAAEQMSTYELVRHYLGTFFRAKDRSSLRGGEFKCERITTGLRRGMNRLRGTANLLLTPVDKGLHRLGIRYISQIIVAGR